MPDAGASEVFPVSLVTVVSKCLPDLRLEALMGLLRPWPRARPLVLEDLEARERPVSDRLRRGFCM